MNAIIKNRLIGIIRQAVFLFNYLSMPFESSCFPLPLKSASSISCFPSAQRRYSSPFKGFYFGVLFTQLLLKIIRPSNSILKGNIFQRNYIKNCKKLRKP